MIAVFKLQTMCYEDCFRHDPRSFAPPHSPTHMIFFSPRRHTLKWENLANRFQSIFRVGRQWTWSSRTLAGIPSRTVIPTWTWIRISYYGRGAQIVGPTYLFFPAKRIRQTGGGAGTQMDRLGVSVEWCNFFFEPAWLRWVTFPQILSCQINMAIRFPAPAHSGRTWLQAF